MAVVVAFAKPSTILVHAGGEVTYEECQRAFDQMLGNPLLAPGTRMLVDARTVDAAPTTSELRAIARDMKPVVDRGLSYMAIVTDRPFVYGVVRMFAVFAEVFAVQVNAFRTMDEGQRWLDERRPREAAR